MINYEYYETSSYRRKYMVPIIQINHKKQREARESIEVRGPPQTTRKTRPEQMRNSFQFFSFRQSTATHQRGKEEKKHMIKDPRSNTGIKHFSIAR